MRDHDDAADVGPLPEPGRVTERRRVTVLFADITGFTSLVEQAGDEAAYEIIGACLRLLDAIVIKHGGRVEKHAGDCVVAAFADAPRAALRAALEMRRAVPAYARRRGIAKPLEVHSGVETGAVSIDADQPVLGDFVDLASKLKDASPAGEIWVGAETFRATVADVPYRAVDPQALRGRKITGAIHAVVADDASSERARGGAFSSPLVGRDPELAALRERLAALARGESGVAWISAETGLGKSRLIAELRDAPETTAVRWIEVSPAANGSSASHAFFAALLRAWAGIGADDVAAPRAKLESALERLLGSDGAAAVLPFAATQMGVRLRPEERRRVDAFDAAARAAQVSAAAARLLRAIAAERPLALVLDDLDGADAASMELLADLMRPGTVSPLLFVVAARPGAAARLLEEVRAERSDALVLPLAPLDRDAAIALLGDLLGGGALPDAVRQELVAKAAGSPLFVEEALRVLRDAGALQLRDGALHATDRIAHVAIPDTLDAILDARLARLPVERRRVLEAAAAAGTRFWLPLLAVALGRHDLGDEMPTLEETGFLVAGEEQEWSFRHPRIREVAIAKTAEPQRLDLARRVAEAVELSETGRRRATVLFADVVGFSGGDDASSYEALGACLRRLDAIVVRHGGHVEKHAGDGVVAVFGAPVAIENAPRAALNAALEMRRVVRDAGGETGRALDLHGGVNTGSVIADPRKSAGTADLPVFGDVVNVASRLKDQAPPGAIWVGRETWRATREEFEYRTLEPLALKGKRAAVAVYELSSAEPRLHRPRAGGRGISSPMVGRERELALLRERLAALARGESGVVTILADAGLGKSRLLDEVQRLPEAQACRWLEGRSLSTGHAQHHHPFVDLLRTWAGVGPAADAALGKLSDALDRLLGEDAAEALPFLATLLNVPLGDAERRRFESVQDEARARLLERAVTEVFARLAAERPLVLFFEDLHWADASSIELLCELLRPAAIAPALFVLAARPRHAETSGRVLAFLDETRPDAACIELAPLGAAATGELVEHLFAGGHVPRATRETILAKVAGNPFFAEEVVRALVDEGAVEVRDGRLHATDRIHAAVIPGTVEETIQVRLDRLPAPRRHVLEAAAVVGFTFWEPVLAEVLGKEDLPELLAALAGAELVVGGDATEWSFKHPLIQEVAYGAMLRSRREELHRHVGEAIELCLTDRAPGYHAMLAFHFGRGGDLARAEESLFRAGADAARSAASNEALRFFREAAALYFQLHGAGGDAAKKAQLEKHLGMALMNRGQLGEAVDRFADALAHLGDPVSRSPAKLYRQLVWDLGNVALGLYLPRGGRRPQASDAQREQIDIRFRRGLAQTTTAPGPVILADTVATLRRLERVDPASVPEAGGIYSGAIAIFSYGGVSFELGRRILERARAVVEGGNARETVLYFRVMQWIHHYLSGDWSAAHDIDDALLEEGLRYGRLWEVQTFLDLDGERSLFRGDWAAAARRLDALARFDAAYRHGTAAAAHQALTAYRHLERRELAPALAAMQRYYRENDEASFQLQALGMTAKIHALGGDLVAAEDALSRAASLVERAGEQPPFHRSRYDLARLLVGVARLSADAGADRRRGLLRRTLAAERAALRGAAKVAARRPEVLRLSGTLAALRGRLRAAARAYERSAATAEALGMQPERARTLLEASRRGFGVGALDAAACRAEALRVFDEHELDAEALGA